MWSGEELGEGKGRGGGGDEAVRGRVGHLFNGDHGEDMTSRRSCAGGREATRVCLKREARHEIASVVLLTRTSTCAPIDPWGRKEVAVTGVLEVVV